MQQTIPTQSGLAGLSSLLSPNGGGTPQAGGLIFGQNGALSFQTFLLGTLEGRPEVTGDAPSGLSGFSLLSSNPLLQAQQALGETSDENADLWQQLRSNISSMFTPKSPQGSSEGTNSDISALTNTLDSIDNDILFLFNTPLAGNNANGVFNASSEASSSLHKTASSDSLLNTPLSSDLVQHLILQSQGIETATDLEAALNNIDLSKIGISTDIASMNLDDFKDLKKAAFADMTPFLTQTTTKDLGNGKIMKITHGPAFLSEDNNTSSNGAELMVMLVAPQDPQQIQQLNLAAGQNAQAQNTTSPALTGAASGQQLAANATAGQIQQPQAPKGSAASTQNGFGLEDGDSAPVSGSSDTSKPANVKPLIGQIIHMMGGHQQQSTVQASLLGSSALNPNGQGTAAQNMLVFENLFAPHGDPAEADFLETMSLDSGTPKADMQSAAFKASTLVNAKGAGYPHPATQNVAHQISAAVSKTPQGDRQINMQLDPPELGNVMIQIKFGKDNSVKAHLTVERPETLSLLQKDSASLEKALQEAGLDTSGDSLSFDLKQGGDGQNDNFFNKNNGGSGKDGDSAETEEVGPTDVIETQMSVFVDPETGQQRINMLV